VSRFHQAAISLLSTSAVVPAVSSSALRTLMSLERRLGILLPASLQEWYSLDNAIAVLKTFSNRRAPDIDADR